MSAGLVLVDDHQVLREGIGALLGSNDDFEVLGGTSTGIEALRLVEQLHPDVVILDITLEDMSGMEVARRIKQQSPRTRILALSVHEQPEMVTGILEAGADGYVQKGASFREIVEALHIIQEGKTYLSPGVARVLVDSLVASPGRAPREDRLPLSPREQEVLRLLANGKSTKEIAFDLDVSARTIETHRRHIMEKLGIDNVAGLTKYAIRKGLSDLA